MIQRLYSYLSWNLRLQGEDAEFLSDEEEEEEEEEVDEEVALMTWRTHPKDETGIANILNANTENIYGKMDIVQIMEKSLFQVLRRVIIARRTFYPF